jgi:hypothetical protein
LQPDSRQEFGADSICDGVDDRGAIVGGIDVHAKRSGPVPHLDHVPTHGPPAPARAVGRDAASSRMGGWRRFGLGQLIGEIMPPLT